MTSNFSINHIFESNLEADFTIDDGIFINNNDTFILSTPKLKNVKSLTNYSDIVLYEDNDNYFNKEYRLSTDNITWPTWNSLPVDLTNITLPVNDIYIQFRYTFISTLTTPIPIELKQFFLYGERIIDEIFEPSTIANGESAVFTNTDTYKVFDLQSFELFASNTNLDIYLRYTQTQGRLWSDWVKCTDENLQNLQISKINFCDFQFAFVNNSGTDIDLYDFELIGDFQNVTANYQGTPRLGLKTQCNPLLNENFDPNSCEFDANGNLINDLGSITNSTSQCKPCSQSEVPWNKNPNCSSGCDTSNYVNMHDKKLWSELIKTNYELNEFMNKMNSHKVTYFLTDPDIKGIDHILHEQQIHNIIKMSDIQIVVPENKFMNDTINFSGLDLDLITSFEVHILKSVFKDTFGVEFRPSKRDVIYFCDNNQLWEIEQMFPSRNFMHTNMYYRVLLKKYNDRSSRQYANTQDGQDAKDLIDALTNNTTLDQLFGSDVDNEIRQTVKDLVPNTDGISSQQHQPLTDYTVRKRVDSVVNIVDYDLRNATLRVAKYAFEMPIKSENKKLVEYNTKDKVLSKGENRAINFWWSTTDYDSTYRWDLINNFDSTNNEGYKLTLENNVLTFQINNGIFTLNAMLEENVWYSFLVNINNTKEEIELAIYKRQNENGAILNSSKLILVNKLKYNINPYGFNIDETFYIGGSTTNNVLGNRNKWYITNLRLFIQPIPVKARTITLNEYTISDSQLTLIVDNAEPELKLPKYGNL